LRKNVRTFSSKHSQVINLVIAIILLCGTAFFGFRAAADFGYVFHLKFPILFGEFSKEIKQQMDIGGTGGSVKIGGQNSGTAIGGDAGGGGPGGQGGAGGGVEIAGDNNGFVMGGEGGEAGQADRGGKGGRGPLEVLQEQDPEMAKEIMQTFNISEEEAKTYGRGGDGAGPRQTSG
jgi:hypothetical protein